VYRPISDLYVIIFPIDASWRVSPTKNNFALHHTKWQYMPFCPNPLTGSLLIRGSPEMTKGLFYSLTIRLQSMVHVKQGMITLIYYSYIWRWKMMVIHFFRSTAWHSVITCGTTVHSHSHSRLLHHHPSLLLYTHHKGTLLLPSRPPPVGRVQHHSTGWGGCAHSGVTLYLQDIMLCSPAHKLLVWRIGNFASFHCSTSFPGTNDVSIVDYWDYVNST